MKIGWALFCLFLGWAHNSFAQSLDSNTQRLQQLPVGYLNRVSSQAQSIDQSLQKKTDQYMNKLSKLEAKLWRKLKGKDTAVSMPYQQWGAQMQQPIAGAPATYVPGLDTLSTTLKFLQTQQIPGSTSLNSSALSSATAQVQQLQGDLNQGNLIQQYVAQRKQMLAQWISQYTHLPPGVTTLFSQYKETSYYYQQQLEQYKAMLNDPEKMEREAVTILNTVPAYTAFMAKYSMLASLFQLPAGYGSGSASTQGLQTQSQIQQLLQSQVGGGGGAQVQQQLQAAQSQVTSMQNAVSKFGSGGQDLTMPNFQPNTQKTKTFWHRLQYGANIQFQKTSLNFPTTGDLGLSVAYKLNDKGSIGVGASYNIGLGTGWNDIQFSNQGVGLRSFMDWKIKKTYYVTGGYELNYMSAFSEISQLQNRSAWQPSLLVGLEKKYKISSKLQGNLQILFDALYKQEIPQGQMIKFRVGYAWP